MLFFLFLFYVLAFVGCYLMYEYFTLYFSAVSVTDLLNIVPAK